MSPVERIINEYENMRREFSAAIELAGGNADAVMQASEWSHVLAILVANNISIRAVYEGPLKV